MLSRDEFIKAADTLVNFEKDRADIARLMCSLSGNSSVSSTDFGNWMVDQYVRLLRKAVNDPADIIGDWFYENVLHGNISTTNPRTEVNGFAWPPKTTSDLYDIITNSKQGPSKAPPTTVTQNDEVRVVLTKVDEKNVGQDLVFMLQGVPLEAGDRLIFNDEDNGVHHFEVIKKVPVTTSAAWYRLHHTKSTRTFNHGAHWPKPFYIKEGNHFNVIKKNQ